MRGRPDVTRVRGQVARVQIDVETVAGEPWRIRVETVRPENGGVGIDRERCATRAKECGDPRQSVRLLSARVRMRKM